MATIPKKHKVVAEGLFKAELNEFFQRHLCENGYSGCDVRKTLLTTEIVLRATSTRDIIGADRKRINELTSLVCQRFQLDQKTVQLYVEAVPVRGLCAIAQAENLKFKLLQGLAVRRAAYGILRQVMGSGAKGCEVVVSGKLKAARAKSMKFTDGFMIHSGNPRKQYVVSAVRHVMLRQGVLGVKVKIMLDYDPEGKKGPSVMLPDVITVHEPKEEVVPITQHRTEFPLEQY